MAMFNYFPVGKKGLLKLYDWLDEFTQKNHEYICKKNIGKSSDNKWDIPAFFVTNKQISDEDKQISVITLARHGQEKGARVVGPEILNYLVSDDAKIIRDRQIVILIPVLNPEGFILDEFHSSKFGITDTEREVLGNLCDEYKPDMMMDYHSLGKVEGSKYDIGDMEVIIPANTSKWGMDEQIYQYTASKMADYSSSRGWPFEVHTLEDLSSYYFGDPKTGRLPRRYLKNKVYLLDIQDFNETYDFPGKPGYTNYTCGPAYNRWHTLVFGIETNHWSLNAENVAISGLIPCIALLKMGQEKAPWEKEEGYPINLLCGDFRISIRAKGSNHSERRLSREKIWNVKDKFSILKRELIDPETTLVKVCYIGEETPLEFALCLRMRQKLIKKVLVEDKDISFDTFTDKCSTFLYFPLSFNKENLLKIKIKHDAFNKRI